MQTAYRIVSGWLSDNFLKLNDGKSEVILVGSPNHISNCKNTLKFINLGSSNIKLASTVKNLGVIFDESLSFMTHITNCRKNSFLFLNNLRHIRSYFSRSNFESIIHAFITSKLDYCNSLFTNLPNTSIAKLQSIQNYAARLILRRGLYSHITPLLHELHWLPVCDRITFKVLLITFKVIHNSSPLYLLSQLRFKTNPRNLRHHDPLLLDIPRSRSARMGDRSFSTVAPKLWNPLPFHIRSAPSVTVFKSQLKEHLFTLRYSHLS